MNPLTRLLCRFLGHRMSTTFAPDPADRTATIDYRCARCAWVDEDMTYFLRNLWSALQRAQSTHPPTAEPPYQPFYK